VTVYYRWHPFFGLSLPVRKRKKDFSGEQIFCQLPDDVICSFPAWMFSPECTQHSLGSPLIAVEALVELHELLAAVQVSSRCDKALSKQTRKEEGNEAARATRRACELAADELDTPGSASDKLAGRSTKRTSPRFRVIGVSIGSF
jgi:hypothetical protein